MNAPETPFPSKHPLAIVAWEKQRLPLCDKCGGLLGFNPLTQWGSMTWGGEPVSASEYLNRAKESFKVWVVCPSCSDKMVTIDLDETPLQAEKEQGNG